MTAGKLTGSASISFEQPVYIESAAAIAGKKKETALLETFLTWFPRTSLRNPDLGGSRKHSSKRNRRACNRKSRTDSP